MRSSIILVDTLFGNSRPAFPWRGGIVILDATNTVDKGLIEPFIKAVGECAVNSRENMKNTGGGAEKTKLIRGERTVLIGHQRTNRVALMNRSNQ